MTKSIFKSWTFYFAVLQVALGAVGYFSGLMDQSSAWTLVATGATTLGLRLKTTQPVSFSGN